MSQRHMSRHHMSRRHMSQRQVSQHHKRFEINLVDAVASIIVTVQL